MPRPHRTLRSLGVAIVGLIGVGALLVAVENVRSRRAVRAYKAQLVGQGEKLGIDELTPAFSITARNAANDLIQAAWQLRTGTSVPGNMPAPMRMTSPGKAWIASMQPDIRDPGRVTNNWETVAEDLQRNAEVLRQIREALKSPAFDAGLDYRQGFHLFLPHLAKLKSIAQWLSAATICDLHAGHRDEALANLNALLSLSRAFRDEHLLISQLVRIAVAAIAFAPSWETLQLDGWTDAQLAELQRGWESMEFMGSMEEALQMERAMGLEMFDRLRKSSDERKQMFSDSLRSGGGAPPGLAPPNNAVEIPEFASHLGEKTLAAVGEMGAEKAWLWIWSHRDERKYLEVLQTILDVTRQSRGNRSFTQVYSNSTNRLNQFWEKAGRSAAYYLSRSLAPSLEKASTKAARMEVQRELSIAAIALKRYQLRHGTPAPNLAALVPEFLSKPPVDFMDGRELRYRPNPNGRFLLYSINEDGKDDGGDPRPVNENSSGRFPGMGRDFVWPTPATQDEITASEVESKKK